MYRPCVQKVNYRRAVIRNNNSKISKVKWSAQCKTRQSLVSADIVLRFAAIQLKPPLCSCCSFNIPPLAKARHCGCNNAYQYRQVTANIYSKNILSCHYSFSETMQADLLLYISKTPLYFQYLFLRETIILEILWARTKNSEELSWKDYTLRSDLSDIIVHCSHARFTGTRKNGWYLWQYRAQGNSG
jgi:hypothetical protein